MSEYQQQEQGRAQAGKLSRGLSLSLAPVAPIAQFSIADCEINISLISLIIQVQVTTTDTDVTFACVICGGDGGWVASATFQWSPPHNPRILGESFYQKLK